MKTLGWCLIALFSLGSLAVSPAPACAEGNDEFDTTLPDIKFKPSGALPAGVVMEARGEAAAGVAAADAPAVSGEVDMAPFYKRLEDLGMDSKELRGIAQKIECFFRAPGGDAFAEYAYIRDNLYIPDEFKQDGTDKIRYDLKPHEIDTVIHEFTHAARDVSVSEDSPKGTPSRAHYEAVEAIWGNLRSRSFLYRYAWMKADEVSGYFMGAAVASVFELADDIITYNKSLGGAQTDSEEEAVRLGGTLLLPPKETAKPGWEKGLLDRVEKPFGRNKVYDSAMFKDNVLSNPEYIHWEEITPVRGKMERALRLR